MFNWNVFLLLRFQSYMHTLDSKHLPVVKFANMLPHYLSFLFDSLIFSFICFSSKPSHLSIFHMYIGLVLYPETFPLCFILLVLSDLTLKSLIYFEMHFINGGRHICIFIILHVDSLFFQVALQKWSPIFFWFCYFCLLEIEPHYIALVALNVPM